MSLIHHHINLSKPISWKSVKYLTQVFPRISVKEIYESLWSVEIKKLNQSIGEGTENSMFPLLNQKEQELCFCTQCKCLTQKSYGTGNKAVAEFQN